VAKPRSTDAAEPDYLIADVAVGTVWYRLYPVSLPGVPDVSPLWFGPGAGKPPAWRFDDPGPGSTHPEAPALAERAARDAGRFDVCYLATTPEAAFVETFLRRSGRAGRKDVDRADRDARRLATARVTAPLRLADLRGPGLARAHLDAGVTTTRDYALPQCVARVVWRHPERLDGLVYHARHDPAGHAVALFDRARDALTVTQVERLDDDMERLLMWAARYGFRPLF
jgi:hypothetical protein